MNNKYLKLIQISRYRWKLVSYKGHVIVDEVMVTSSYKAEEWCKQYISSFPGWDYEIIPMR
jgi:hypothetical protein